MKKSGVTIPGVSTVQKYHSSADIDTSEFKCFKSAKDGSTYYGQVAYFDKQEENSLVSAQELETSILSVEQKEERY